MCESRRDFQRVWEGWEAGFMAFHTLSFPWPAFRVPMLDNRFRHPSAMCLLATRCPWGVKAFNECIEFWHKLVILSGSLRSQQHAASTASGLAVDLLSGRSSIFLTFLEGKLSMNPRSIGLFLLLCAIPAVAQVSTGIDVLEQQNFAPLKQIAARHGGHLRLGVLTNPVGIDAHEMRTIDVLRKDAAAAVPGLSVKVIFTAEHGINAAVDKFDIDNGTDIDSGLPIVSISGSTPAQKRPSAQQLSGLDAVVIDLQDVGARYWTFQVLMGYFLEASAANHVDIVVLDRPNPINGLAVQGPLATPGREDYTCYYAEPLRPGMTMGELAELFNGEKHLGAQLTVVKMIGWHRTDWYDDTGLLWVNPSPNIRSLTQQMVYTGTGLIEGTNVNIKGPVGPPFVRFGAPWIVASQLAAYLNARKIPGVSFMAISYTPPERRRALSLPGKTSGGRRNHRQ
jgi:uncharacterized protein YbbC (DUF1343 family)